MSLLHSPALSEPQSVHIAHVTKEMLVGHRVMYRVQLSCGCEFWEYHPRQASAPRLGEEAVCFAPHARDAIAPSSRHP